jgi:hypothetical protein
MGGTYVGTDSTSSSLDALDEVSGVLEVEEDLP